jgi:hypothetical protein
MKPVAHKAATATKRTSGPAALAVAAAIGSAGCCCEADSVDGFILSAVVTATSEAESHVGVFTQACGGEFSDPAFDTGCGDRFVASADGERRVLAPATGHFEFETAFETGAAGTEFRISLERPELSDPDDAIGSLPAAFEIVGEIPDEVSRQTDEIVVDWAPSGTADRMYVEIQEAEGQPGCIRANPPSIAQWDYSSGPIPDEPPHSIPPGTLGFMTADRGPCAVILSVRRGWSTDSGCGGFGLFIVQERSFAFTLIE